MRIQSAFILIIAVLAMAVFSVRELTKRQLEEVRYRLKTSTEQSVSRLSYMMSHKVKEAHSELKFLFQHRESKFQGEPSFHYIAELRSLDHGGLQVHWKRSFSPLLESWSGEELLNSLQSLSLGEITSGSMNADFVYFGKVSSKYSQPYVATLIQGGGAIYMGLLPIYFFSDIDEYYKGGKEQAIVIDDKGSALVYPERKYLASKVAGHSIVKSILSNDSNDSNNSNKKIKDSGEYVDFNNHKLIGSYQQIEGSNLYGAVTQKVPLGGYFLGSGGLNLFIVAIAIILIAIGFLYSLQGVLIGRYEYLLFAVNSLAKKFPIEGLVGGNKSLLGLQNILLSIQSHMSVFGGGSLEDSLPSEASQEGGAGEGGQKMGVAKKAKGGVGSAFDEVNEVALTLLQSCQGTLSVILGHVQMAREKASKGILVDHLKTVESEARHLQGVNEQLLEALGFSKDQTAEVDFGQAIMGALQSLKGEIDRLKIKVSKKMEGEIFLSTVEEHIDDLLHRLLSYVISSMEESADKELSIELCREGDKAHLILKDTGREVPQRVLKQILDPLSLPKEEEGLRK